MKIIEKFYFYFIFFAISGLLIGAAAGHHILSSSIRGEITPATFMFSAGTGFSETFSLINSADEFKRIAGYYAYRDSGFSDYIFLYERYKLEESLTLRKTIIWVAEGCLKKEKLLDFYNNIYSISSDETKIMLQNKIAGLKKYHDSRGNIK